MSNYKVLITASGLGQRLGDLTRYTNKALVRIGRKNPISYIVESYPKDTEFVVTLGHYSDQVKDFLGLAYPDRDFTFVEVDNYSGPGSSLGYSMLCAKAELQCPFIFHAGDTIITDAIPKPDKNWIGGHKGGDASQYSSWKIVNGGTFVFNDKGALDFDCIHIGLVGINDHASYWRILENLYIRNPNDSALNDCAVIVKMLEEQKEFHLVDFSTWFDTGNIAALHYAREHIPDHFKHLDKVDESIFLFDNFVIKFFFDKKTVLDRVARAEILNGLVPDIEGYKGNFYRYRYVEGDLYSRVASPTDFLNFLGWAKRSLWKPVEETDNSEFKKICRDFYESKTKKRVSEFFEISGVKDKEQVINGDLIPKLEDIFGKIDFEWLSDSEQYQFHGDFILDNILKTSEGYCLLDWRQDFGGLLRAGDKYYDLGKLNHNLVVNHDIVGRDLFTIETDKSGVSCDILRDNRLVQCQEVLFDFLRNEGYDIRKVKLLTSLIWLNMSPLHHHPFNLFLFYFGKWNLWRVLNEKN